MKAPDPANDPRQRFPRSFVEVPSRDREFRRSVRAIRREALAGLILDSQANAPQYVRRFTAGRGAE